MLYTIWHLDKVWGGGNAVIYRKGVPLAEATAICIQNSDMYDDYYLTVESN
jgi:hypothetical protein